MEITIALVIFGAGFVVGLMLASTATQECNETLAAYHAELAEWLEPGDLQEFERRICDRFQRQGWTDQKSHGG